MTPKCSYFLCKSVTGQKPLFRFPTRDSRRLQAWIDNCGNKNINHLTKALNSKYLCIDHFETRYIQNEGGKRVRLNKLAVPVPYRGYETTEASSAASKYQGTMEINCLPNLRTAHFFSMRLDGITCQPEEHYQGPDLMVQKPNKVYHNYHKQICAELAKESNGSPVTVVENYSYCMECERPIHGCQWWCLQCSGVRCGKCAVRMSHRQHYILRTPANSTQEQTEAVLEAIRRHMSVDFFVRQPDIRHVDGNGVDLTATDEPEVKAEPPEIDDPFDPFACNRVEDDPLACTTEDPLAECKHVVEDIPIAEPSIDYQPGNSLNAQSPVSLELTEQNSPQKPLGVELYSPVHPGLEAYEISLAQCSGIDDFMCSERILIDSQSIDHPEGQIDSHGFDDYRSSGTDHRPPSIQARVPTRFTYGEDNSDDCLEAIDEQPSHSHIYTESEQYDDQIRRPWVQVLSSQKQNNTVKTIQHKTQQKRLVVQPPPNKEQNILAKQQNIQTKRPWVQVFSNKEQKSTDAKQKNHSRSEQSHIEDICEEQSSTVTEIQDCHDPLEQSNNNDEEQVPTATVKRNSGEKQSSTTTAKRKRKIIIIKKGLYTTGMQREFTETNDDNNVQSARGTETSDMNTTTEPTNTLFNLDDKKIITTKKLPRTQYATHIRRDFPEPTDDNIDIDNNVQCVRDTLHLNMTSEATNTLLNLDEHVRDKVLEYPLYQPNIEEQILGGYAGYCLRITSTEEQEKLD